MSHLMSLWDYRQALYAEAAKWVAGDIGKPGMTSWNESRCWRKGAVVARGTYSNVVTPEGCVHQPGPGIIAEPGSYAGIGYRIALPHARRLDGNGQ